MKPRQNSQCHRHWKSRENEKDRREVNNLQIAIRILFTVIARVQAEESEFHSWDSIPHALDRGAKH
jgi:hypothetical protein